MKKLVIYLVLLLGCNSVLWAQQKSGLDVKQIVLDNGLTVFLNEDHSEPKVFGAVVVKAGSKNDPEGATGTAHYFEHIMFKGTDSIGTLNYASEKVYLDSIAQLYDILNATTNENQRQLISQHINVLSIKAAEFAIPNEVDKLIQKYGGTQLNAYTSFEQTVYHNVFPPNQIERWLKTYAERFRNPVFRLFQSELETVYEERNMYADQMGSKMMEDLFKEIFKKHPYRNPIIGTVADLKNPSLTKMSKFYKTYYVPNNMALVLTGDFDSEKIIPLIKNYFGVWEKAEVPAFQAEKYKETPFKAGENYTGRYIPINMGMFCYRGIPRGHKEEEILDICCNILSNSAETGLLDSLRVADKVMGANASSMQLNDEGIIMITFIPKVIGGSLSKTQEQVMQIIQRLKRGDFEESLLNSIKLNYRKQDAASKENAIQRGSLLISAYAENSSLQSYFTKIDRYQQVTKEDVVRVANQYFTENYMTFINKRGFSGKADKIAKPDYKPIVPKNAQKESAFAQKLSQMKDIEVQPIFIDFNKDFRYEDIKKNVHLITSNNPVNDVFSFSITFGAGELKDSILSLLEEHITELGTQQKSVTKYREAMQKIGSSFSVDVSDNSVSISASGFDDYFPQTIALVNEMITSLKPNNAAMNKLTESIKLRKRMEEKDQNTQAYALYNYVLYGNESSYIKRITASDLKKITSEMIVESFKKIQNYETTIGYVGTLSFDKVKAEILKTFSFPEHLKKEDTTVIDSKTYAGNAVFVSDNSKANQSSVAFYIKSKAGNEKDRLEASLFNQYFGVGMSSLLFQEIREFRSLSYVAYGSFSFFSRQYPTRSGIFNGYISTQSDKTEEALAIFMDLLKEMPEKPEKMEVIKNSVKESINSSKPGFRAVPGYAYSLIEEGFKEDYRKIRYEFTETAEFGDIVAFYKKFIQEEPRVIMLTGNKKKMNLKEFEKYGEVKVINKKNLFKN